MPTPIPANPQYVNSVTSGTDTSIVNSTTAGGLDFFPVAESPVVTSNSHPVVARADGALYDITAGAYVSIQNTNIGTTAVPKNGQ
jgi:hypothetical protein